MRSIQTLVVSIVVITMHIIGPVRTAAAEPPKLALLVGCTEYRNHSGLRELYGPANDLPMWASLLTEPKGFAFPKENVTQLVGWPKEEAKRPTYANIVKGFENLIAKAEPDSRIVIVLSGHGTQVPIPESQTDPLDPKNPEPDGLDEVFLPADVGDWTKSGLKNAILDDQFGVWLDKLRDKGAHVLIVFDCCHSGTMTRGGPGVREINRFVSWDALKIPEAAIREAITRASKAIEEARKAGRPVPGEATVKERDKKERGSLVAFYAAQPFEEAPELPLPEGKEILKENYYGLLSFTLVETIRQRQSGLTYGELERLVAAGYLSSRATRPPTPFAEGDLNREVLGMKVWPNRPRIYLQRDKKSNLRVDAGALHGLTEGSILAVQAIGGSEGVLGYVKVGTVDPSSASVTPAKFDDKPALQIEKIKVGDLARCEVVRKDFGDLQVKLFTDSAAVTAALAKLPEEPKAMVKKAGETEAEWILQVVTPKQAAVEYGINGLTADEVFLVQGIGRTRDPKEQKSANPMRPKVFGRYQKADEPALVGGLARDLPKVFTWQNVWRVANKVSAAEGGETYQLQVEVVKLKDEKAKDGELLRDGRLANGQEVLFRAKNEGPHDLWVSAFYLDANLGIKLIYSAGVSRGQVVKLAQGTMTAGGQSVGREGLVVFAVPQSVAKDRPNFAVIEQGPMRVADRSKGGAGERTNVTPFGRLLAGAAINKVQARDFTPRVPSTPAILTQSWALLPDEADRKPGEQGGFIPRPDRPRLELRPDGGIAAARLSHDGKRLITVSASGVARMWDAITGRQVREFGKERQSGTNAPVARVYDDGKRLGVMFEGQIQIWDLATSKLVRTLATRDDIIQWGKLGGPETALLLSLAGGQSTPDGGKIWHSVDGRLVLFDVAGAVKEAREFDAIGTGYRIKTVAFSPDTRVAATGHNDGTVALWDVQAKRIKRSWKGHSKTVVHVAFDRGGTHLVTAGSDQYFRRWEVATGKEVGKVKLSEQLKYDHHFSISVHSSVAVTTQILPPAGWHLLVWDLERGEQAATLKLGDYCLFPRFTADGRGVIAPMYDPRGKGAAAQILHVWVAPRDKDALPQKREGHDYKSDVHLGRGLIASIGVEKDSINKPRDVIEIRSWATDALVRTLRPDDSQRAHQVRFSPDGKHVAVDTSPLMVWETDSGTVVLTLQNRWFKSWSADGRYLTTRESVMGDRWRNRYEFWDITERKMVGEFREADHVSNGHWQLCGMGLSADGTRLLTAGIEGDLRVWDTDKGATVKVIRAHQRPIAAAALAPDGRLALSAAQDGVMLWEVDTGRAVRPFILPKGRSGSNAVAAGFLRGSQEVFIADRTEVRIYSLDEN